MKAERVASVIFNAIHDNVATKADVPALGAELKAELTAQVGGLRAELKGEITGVRSLLASEVARLATRIERLDAKMEQVGHRLLTQFGGLMVLLIGLLLVALRYLPPPHG